MRIFFHLLYNQFAWTYDFVAATVSLGQWVDWVLSTLQYVEGPSLLELGFGPGHLQRALTRKGVAAFGVDASPQMSRIAKRRAKKQNLEYRLICGEAQALPFPNGQFHQIVSTFPPNFILQNQTLTEAYRTLRPGGSLIILLTAWITGHAWLEKIAAWLFRVSGQSPKWQPDLVARFRQVGFQAQVDHINEKSWRLLVIHLRKPEGSLTTD